MSDPGATSPTSEPRSNQPTDRRRSRAAVLRMYVLFSVLGALLFALWYDYKVARVGVEQAYTAIDAVMLGAAAGNMEIATAADLATNVMSSFGLEAEDVTGIMDMMFKASASSPAN